ncbi:MAG: tail fiber protein [Serratia sp. (in: enterobacteria)]|uniref:tail fiber protein n=1 Tax=Serratia sp. (in: enterobacteria) TaxID=616 RepID=UPI003F365F7D
MTDKTPKNTAETAVNTSAALAKTTDTAREGEALPQADTLKARFKAGSIPLQTDFADLIDLANIGRQAVGDAEGQTGPANGFTLSDAGLLELKPNEEQGISVDQDGVAIKLKTISGLTMDKDGVSVKPKADSGIELKDSAGISLKPGNGISVDKDGIAVRAEGNKGLQVTNNGVSVKPGNSIAVNSSGVNVKLSKGTNRDNGGGGHGSDGVTSGAGGGLFITSNGLSVDAGSGIQIDEKGVSIKLATYSGLIVSEANGLSIAPAQIFRKGMIMMFAGVKNELPPGWAFCDGGSGTPDLRDRFIVMAGTKFTEKGDGTTSTGSATVTGTVNVAETKLTIAQIPKHSHPVELNSFKYITEASGAGELRSLRVHRYGSDSDGWTATVNTDYTGSDQGHKHTATMATSSHSHTISAIPPYYALAFIMKL